MRREIKIVWIKMAHTGPNSFLYEPGEFLWALGRLHYPPPESERLRIVLVGVMGAMEVLLYAKGG